VNRHHKIQPQHVERLAYVYIRQSTLYQVGKNLESQDLQYQLTHRAQVLGWAADQVIVIDDDLGKSGVTSAGRQGFQTLVTAVGLAKVGIILVTDVSRLARNCSDWYGLLDLASVCGTLISDAEMVYDPRNYNDRLLLGLKGTFSEAQWYQMRTQLYAAELNKARRGELAVKLPIGYDRLAEGKVVFTANQEVQSAIRLVFEQFERLGSARATLLYFRDRGLELPRCVQSGPDKGKIEWVKPSYQAVYRMLKNPAYAGAYTYGKRHNVRVPGAERKVVTRVLPMKEWPVLIREAFPGYITWEQCLANQKQLRENAQGANWGKGAPRSGLGLLQGIAVCGRCGHRLHTRYSNNPAYVCDRANTAYGDPFCQMFMVPHIDEAVTQVFLEAIQPAHLEVALSAIEQIEAQRQRLSEQWQQRLERARYEADLARRRYEQVDPDNRLVAAELECRWEEKLQVCQSLEQEWAQAQDHELAPLTEEDKETIRSLAEDVPALWYAETTTMAERKRLLRCLIQDVTLDAFTKPGFSIIHICWHTGTTTVIEAERPRPGCRTAREVVARIRELAQHHTDDQIAGILNTDQIPTATGKTWNLRRVQSVRKAFKIPTGCPYYTKDRGPRGDGLIAVSEAAERLGTSKTMVLDWFRQGLIEGHQRKRQTPIWVRLTEDDVKRLNGSTPLRPGLVEIGEAARVLGTTTEQVWEQVRARQLVPYRLMIKNRWRWCVQLTAEQVGRATEP
jgi:DNA invertase Pin-like site-specific DNA recombinase